MLEKFVDHLPIMPVVQPVAIKNHHVPFYEVTMREAYVKLHRDLPPTRVWGGIYPGPTFHVYRKQPIQVLWKSAFL